jgi:prolyl-tRNA editing enzyme YbaK/EbsC (Cys-tRNA(Pro) deacylase)
MVEIGNVVLQPHKLSEEVISCRQAATAKGIPLKNELKTLIIQTSAGMYAVHLPGNKGASFRAIKKFLNVDEAFLANETQMQQLGLIAGTVSPVKQIVWNLPHLISQELLELEFVSTNDGTRSGYVIFDPKILLKAQNARVGRFSAI